MLHSSFWHHGACDLDPPAWWASVHQPSALHDSSEECGRNAGGQAAAQDGFFLEFLYPTKTLALMHRLSNHGWERWQARQSRAAVRHYSSRPTGRGDEPSGAAARSEEDSADSTSDRSRSVAEVEDSDPDDGQEDKFAFTDDFGPLSDVSPMPLGDTADFESPLHLEDPGTGTDLVDKVENPAEALRSLLATSEPDSNMIWKMWRRTGQADRTPDLSAAVLEYLCKVRPFVRTLAEEVISIFQSLDVKDRLGSSYRGAVMSYLAMGELGRAALVHDEGVRSGKAANANIATASLLAGAIEKAQWQLAIEAYTAIVSQIGPQKELWSVARKSLDLSTSAKSFLIHARRIRLLTGRLPEEQDQIGVFAADFGAQAIRQLASNDNDEASARDLYGLVVRLKRDRFLEARHFEYALGRLVASGNGKDVGELSKVVRKLYRMYIATAKSDPSITVSAKVLHTVLSARTRTMNIAHGTRVRGPRLDIGHIIEDVTHFFRRPSNAMLELLMDAFARIGDVKKVKAYFRQIPVAQRRPFHWEYLLEAYARRGDTAGATQVFETVTQKVGNVPHVRAWNILLHAYARSDDLVGAARVFDKLMESPIQPDAYSFTAMLDLMSQRGDVDGVKDMFALAVEVDENIIKSTEVAGYLVTAFVNSDDIETAELVAQQLRRRKQSGRMTGSFTPIWNILATAHAMRRDLAATRRIYEQMQEEGEEPDGMTYAALLQALCLTRNPDAAFKILKAVIPVKLSRSMALHYAIVMAGYINQGSYEKVPFVDKLRKQRGVHPSTSTRITVAKAVALSEHTGRYKVEPGAMLERTTRVLSDFVLKESPWEWTIEPQTGLGFRSLGQAAGAYFDIIMLIQGDRRAVDTVEGLYELYQKQHQRLQGEGTTQTAMTPPVRMLISLMNAHFKAQAYDEVERLWHIAVDKVATMTEQALPKAAISPDSDHPPANPIAPTRRHLLSRPLVIYLRTLHFQGRYSDAQRTVSGLLTQGYTLDNLAWNLYIQLLARTGRITLAFGLCEQHLMPHWVGWRSTASAQRRKYRHTRGWDYMDINPNRTKRNVVMPQYRTMVFLAAALKYVRRWEAVGGGSSPERDQTTPLSEAILHEKAPFTMAALHSMPSREDDLQQRFLRED